MAETPKMAVSVGQVAEMAIGRLQGKYDALQAALAEIAQASAQLQEEFRYLLSYCEEQAQHSGYALEESAYRDVADKLRTLLDGE